MATVEDTKCETNKPQRYCKGKTLLIIKGTWDNESGGEIFFAFSRLDRQREESGNLGENENISSTWKNKKSKNSVEIGWRRRRTDNLKSWERQAFSSCQSVAGSMETPTKTGLGVFAANPGRVLPLMQGRRGVQTNLLNPDTPTWKPYPLAAPFAPPKRCYPPGPHRRATDRCSVGTRIG